MRTVRPPVSAAVIACNEADHLPRCLAALSWCDEIVVVIDAKSTDASEEIARAAGARVFVRPYEGDVEQKSFCVAQARHDWVLLLDPDEVLSNDLAGQIRAALASPGPNVGFELNRVTFHLGRWIRHGDFYPDWVLRLFQRSRARYVGMSPHGRLVVDGPVGRLPAELPHYSYDDLADQLARIQNFSAQGARSLFESGRRARLHHLVLRPPARFLRAYVLKAGFLDGMPGFLIAAMTAFHVLLKYAKLWELERRAGAAAKPAP